MFDILKGGPEWTASLEVAGVPFSGALLALITDFGDMLQSRAGLCVMALDEIDLKLFQAVQTNNRLASQELAEFANLSATACQRRMKRLRATGVIEGDIPLVSPKAVGRPFSMLVLVSLERERADIIDRFKAAIRATAEVMIGRYATGDADFVLVDQFTRRFFYENANVKSFKTIVVMDRVKAGFSPTELLKRRFPAMALG
jgi:Lrp/AsnC family leucine-responsive transcriptional regulator